MLRITIIPAVSFLIFIYLTYAPIYRYFVDSTAVADSFSKINKDKTWNYLDTIITTPHDWSLVESVFSDSKGQKVSELMPIEAFEAKLKIKTGDEFIKRMSVDPENEGDSLNKPLIEVGNRGDIYWVCREVIAEADDYWIKIYSRSFWKVGLSHVLFIYSITGCHDNFEKELLIAQSMRRTTDE